MKKKPKLLEHYFIKSSKQKEFITIINKTFMIVVCIKEREVEVRFSFDAKRIKKIKKQKSKKVSLEQGLNYTYSVLDNVKSVMDNKTVMGMDILIKELARIAIQNSSEKKSGHSNCCQGG